MSVISVMGEADRLGARPDGSRVIGRLRAHGERAVRHPQREAPLLARRRGGRDGRAASRPRPARSRARACAADRARRAPAAAARARARGGRARASALRASVAARAPASAPALQPRRAAAPLRCSAPAARRDPRALVADAAQRARAQLAQLLVQPRRGGARRGPPARARAARASRARSTIARRPCRSSRAARSCSRALASPQSTGTAASAACVGVEQETAATSSISVRSVWCPTDAITGTRSSATVRHSVSSQNANRSASEPPPRATITTSTSSSAARSCSARVTAGAAWRSCTGANAHTSRPAQPRRRSPASTSSRALPPSPVTTPMQRGSAGSGSRFCGSNRPSACSVRRSRSSWASRSPSPATRTSATANENDGDAAREPG